MPSLDLPALKAKLADRKPGPVHLFVGEDVKLVGRMVDAVEAMIDPADRPFAVERVFACEPGGSPLDIAGVARMFPMLGDRRIVIVLRAERLLKPKRGGKAAAEDDEPAEEGESGGAVDASPLEDYLAAPLPSTTLLFVATEIDKTRRLTKRLLEKALVTEFGGLAADGPGGRRDARQAALDWLKEEMVRSGRAIDSDAARALVGRSGNDITKLRGDVERLLLFTQGRPRITSDDVMEVTSADTSVDDEWGVTNAIAAGDAARGLAEVARRFDRGDSPHALVGQLRWWVSNRLAEADGARVKAALEALLRTDLALKSSGGEERILLERLIVELTGRPVQSPRNWR